LLPGAPVLSTVVAILCQTAVVAAIFYRSKAYSVTGLTALFVGTLILSLGVIADVHYFTVQSGGTCQNPVLLNDDAEIYWADINYHLGAGGRCVVGKYYFGVINAALMRVFGHSIVVPIMANMFCMQCALLLCALITNRLTDNRRSAAVAVFAASSVCFYMSMGTVLLKDAWVIASLALAAYGLVRNDKRAPLTVGLAAVVMAAVKPSYVFAIVLGVAIMMLTQRKRNYAVCGSLIAFCVLLWALPIYVLDAPDYTTGYLLHHSSQYKEFFATGRQNQQAYFNVLGDFFALPLYKRVLMLPLTAIVQFLIPFPWNFARDLEFGYSQVYAHFAYPWYLFAAVVVYYFVFCSRKMPCTMLWLSVWAMACWFVPCVLQGGMVSRYGLPAVTLLAPCVGAVLTENLRCRSFVIWMSVFVAVMATALPICYKLQTSATV
jgi:hypothetical protein